MFNDLQENLGMLKHFIIRKMSSMVIGLCLVLILYVINGCGTYPYSVELSVQNSAGIRSADRAVIVPWEGQRISTPFILKMLTHSESTASSVEGLNLYVRLSVEAYLHCYYRTPERIVYRILPGSHSTKTRFSAGESMVLSVLGRSKTTPDASADSASFLCLASAENLENKLPLFIKNSGETGLPEIDFDTLFRIYQRVTEENLIGRTVLHSV